jgi:hypothetical protein
MRHAGRGTHIVLSVHVVHVRRCCSVADSGLFVS